MDCARRFALALFFLGLVSTGALAGPQQLALGSDRTISLEAPDGWALEAEPAPPDLPARNIAVRADDAMILVTFAAARDGGPLELSADQLEALVLRTSQQYVGSSVERRIETRKLSGGAIRGSYASFTDQRYTAAAPEPGEYRCVTSGAFVVGDVIATVTYLSMDLEGESYEQGLSIIGSFAVRPNEPVPASAAADSP